MISLKHCPFCLTPAATTCAHLALAVEPRDFVRHCIEACNGQTQWQDFCRIRQGTWSGEREDFMWLETAFCDRFLKHLTWFGEMDYEWRTGAKPEQGSFWVLLWSKEPRRLWWELRDEFERQSALPIQSDATRRHDNFLPL